jgi:succinate dehydrogenase/fumarate reductase flavoprotein subunit
MLTFNLPTTNLIFSEVVGCPQRLVIVPSMASATFRSVFALSKPKLAQIARHRQTSLSSCSSFDQKQFQDSNLLSSGPIRGYATVENSGISTDILIVGSGAAALAAALRCKHHGLEPLIIEKTSKIGGSSCYSGGGLWIPNNGMHPGVTDSIPEALRYMEAAIGDAGPASSKERRLAFLENGPKMVQFLANAGFKWHPSLGYPDYEPELPGGKGGGRSIEGEVFDINKLGEWKDKLNLHPAMTTPVPLHTNEYTTIGLAPARYIPGIMLAAKVFGWRGFFKGKLLGRKNACMGTSLVGQLLHLCLGKKVNVWTNSPMKELFVKDGKVVGALIEKDGQRQMVKAKSVILAAGGFAHNSEMRKKYQEAPITGDWTSTPPGDTGDAVSAAMAIGARMELLDAAWWFPSIIHPRTGEVIACMQERALPHTIIVDSAGKRFANEAESYTSLGQAQYVRNRTTPAIPAFMILDSNHRSKYMVAGIRPGKVPQQDLDSGLIVQANTLSELAKKLEIDPEGLTESVGRFNGMAKQGVDEDYGKGKSVYDQFFGDPRYPNKNVGAIDKPPFYAVKLYPGDLGTKGGVLTDDYARAISNDGTIIPNLYAVGNTSASVMGRTYPGAGSTLGPALTFGYIAVNHIAQHNQQI